MSVHVSTMDKKLCNIDNKKSQRYDNIPGKLFDQAHSALAPHLTYLVNECHIIWKMLSLVLFIKDMMI